ncbi:MAG: hypothetical protein ACTHQM_26445 [Thermoanaerobaculia bacterium]
MLFVWRRTTEEREAVPCRTLAFRYSVGTRSSFRKNVTAHRNQPRESETIGLMSGGDRLPWRGLCDLCGKRLPTYGDASFRYWMAVIHLAVFHPEISSERRIKLAATLSEALADDDDREPP